MKTNNMKFLGAGVLAASLLVSCAGTDAETYNVTLQAGSFTTSKYKLMELILPRAHASVSSLTMCFKRLRFKMDDTATADIQNSEDNIDFSPGEIEISSAGTTLGDIVLPAGTYRRLEFDLENDCASGKSLQVVNTNGSFSTTERITIKFSGSFTADSDGVLTLGVQQILDALNSYNGGTSLKDTAENASGDLIE